jgi:glyoxylase-like metal-dependent hydrolase (beta-lactamase superfamily II)
MKFPVECICETTNETRIDQLKTGRANTHRITVKAIIYTHSHGDHIGGANAFVAEEMPESFVADSFGSAEGVD